MTYQFFPDVKNKVIFSPAGAHPQNLYTDGRLKLLVAGLEPGQVIPMHPEGFTLYLFLEGSGWMIVDDQRLKVGPGSAIVASAGSMRGIEADEPIIFMTVRLSENKKNE